MIITILRARDTVQVDEDFDSVLTRPLNALIEIVLLTSDVWFAVASTILKGPIADWDPDVIESESLLMVSA